jgi:hypothetical protein
VHEKKIFWSPWDLIDYDPSNIEQIQSQFKFELVIEGAGAYTVARSRLPLGYFLPFRYLDCAFYDKCLLFAEANGWETFFCPVKCIQCELKKK